MEQYYRQQAGGYLPLYSMQRGRGLFGNIFRLAMPLLKPLAKKALPHVVRAGKNVVKDVIRGKNVGKTIQKHAIRAATDALSAAVNGTTPENISRQSKIQKRKKAGSKVNFSKKSKLYHEAF